ncbi:MAG: magnesium transporter, partial [Anaerolineaceae bacterium]|nr:magnesium transporter [Anaerolineaceae bacterium]
MVKALLVPELRELLGSGDLTTIRTVLEGLHPAAAAELLSGLEPEEIVRILPSLDIHFQADVFSHFEMPLQVDLVEDQGRRPMARLLEEMSPDDRADLVQALPEEVQQELLPLLAHAERADIRRLVSYPEDTVGAVMTTDYATLPEDITAGQALERLRTVAPDAETIYYIYVTDAERRLKGVVSLKTLILARPQRPIGDLMTRDVVSVRAEDDQETVAQEIKKYNWLAMPVVDQMNRLVGLVTVDDVIDVLEDEADEDIYHLGAAGKPTDYFQTRPLYMAGQR